MNFKKLLLLFALCSLAFYVRFGAADDFNPIHLDEYDHLAIASEIESTGNYIFYNPLVKSHPKQAVNWAVFESSFSTLLASLLILLPISLIGLSMPFSIFVAVLASLAALLLSRQIFKSTLAQFVIAASVFFIQTNLIPSGLVFAIPAQLASALLLTLAFLFVKATTSKKYAIIFLAVLVNCLFVHPAFFVFSLLTFTMASLMRPNLLLKNLKWAFLVVFSLVVGLVAIELIPSLGLQDVLFWKPISGWGYDFVGWLSLPGAILAIIGTSVVCRMLIKSQSPRQKTAAAVIVSAVLTGLVATTYYSYTGSCFLGPCPRIAGAFLLFAFILAGVGSYSILHIFIKYISGVPKFKTPVLVLAALALAFMTLPALSYSSLRLSPSFSGPYLGLDNAGVRVGEWIGLNASKGEVVFAFPWDGKGIFVSSGINVTPTTSSRLGKVNALTVRKHGNAKNLITFFEESCSTKKEVLNDFEASWIYQPSAVDLTDFWHNKAPDFYCENINKVFQGSFSNDSIYRWNR
jgi:hypothetical protein